jgi:hypothetical protein
MKRTKKPANGHRDTPQTDKSYLFKPLYEIGAEHLVNTMMGRPPLFPTPKDLLVECFKYFEWVNANPLYEEKGFAYQGNVARESFSKMRAMTLTGLQLFLGITDQTWRNYRDQSDFFGVVTYVEQAIYDQKFTGAAADLLNPKIIIRDLGLADKQELTGANGSPMTFRVKVDDDDSE